MHKWVADAIVAFVQKDGFAGLDLFDYLRKMSVPYGDGSEAESAS